MRVDLKKIESLNSKRYLGYIKNFPIFKHEKTKKYTTVILTFSTVTFFGFFAINPTLTTIAQLHRQLEDAQLVDDQLKQKISNMTLLQQQYVTLGNDLKIILNAIPHEPSNARFLGQIQALGEKNGVLLLSYQTAEVELASANESAGKNESFGFSIQAQGTYDQLLSFLKDLSYFERVVTLETITLTRESTVNSTLLLLVKGQLYFKK